MLPPLKSDNFSKRIILGTGFVEKLFSFVKIFKFLNFKPFYDLPNL